MQNQLLLTVTGDKGGVGKSSITALMTEWFWFKQRPVRVIDADPNQTTQTWLDKCADQGRDLSSSDRGIPVAAGSRIEFGSTCHSTITIVDTAGTSGSSLIKYIREADLILVPFKPHVADLEVVFGWFLSLKDSLQARVAFVPNMVSNTLEQKAGLSEANSIINEEGRGRILPGLAERKAVYPPLLNGSKVNFFAGKLDSSTKAETHSLFTSIEQILGL